MNLLEQLKNEELNRLLGSSDNKKKLPDFSPGDTVIVKVFVIEGTRKRVQSFEGIVIAKRNKGLDSSFIVRKISYGVGVERTFQTYSPLISEIEIKRRGDVRRAKLYYLRNRSGKSARIAEKLVNKNKHHGSPTQTNQTNPILETADLNTDINTNLNTNLNLASSAPTNELNA